MTVSNRFALAIAAALLATPGLAACPDDAAIDQLAADMEAMTPATLAAVPETVEDGQCAQDKLVERLSGTLGEPVGYKVGLTSQAVQERFGASEPIHGRLFGPLLQNGASVPRFASRGLVEADLIVRVKDDGINDATTPMEVLEHITVVRPFIELADLVVAEGQPMTAPIISALNVGARTGVLGPKIEVEASEEFLNSLAEMTVSMETVRKDETTEVMSGVPGRAILGHPLEAVLWLMNDGIKLEPNDLVSLGSLGAPIPAEPGQEVRVTYEGLGDEPIVVTTTLE